MHFSGNCQNKFSKLKNFAYIIGQKHDFLHLVDVKSYIFSKGDGDDIAQNTLKMTLFSIHSGWFMTLAEFEAFLDNFCEFVTILPGPKKNLLGHAKSWIQ